MKKTLEQLKEELAIEKRKQNIRSQGKEYQDARWETKKEILYTKHKGFFDTAKKVGGGIMKAGDNMTKKKKEGDGHKGYQSFKRPVTGGGAFDSFLGAPPPKSDKPRPRRRKKRSDDDEYSRGHGGMGWL